VFRAVYVPPHRVRAPVNVRGPVTDGLTDEVCNIDECLHAQILSLLVGKSPSEPSTIVIVTGDGNENHGRCAFNGMINKGEFV
jgi:hypothetical protein